MDVMEMIATLRTGFLQLVCSVMSQQDGQQEGAYANRMLILTGC